MTKKDIAKHALVAILTLAVFLATLALSLFLFIKVGIVGFFAHWFLRTMNWLPGVSTSPSGGAAAGVLFLGVSAIVIVAAAPFISAWFTQAALAHLCWGDKNFYESKTFIGRIREERAVTKTAKKYHEALIIVEKEMGAVQKEEVLQQVDPEPLKQNQQKQFTPYVTKLKKLLCSENADFPTPKEFVQAAEQCEIARKHCAKRRKEFTMSRSG